MASENELVAAAAERHARGYNCAQAVVCAFADELGADERLLFRAFEGHGLGMGGMRCTCGALTGACAVAGLASSCGDLGRPVSKGATYKLSRQIVERFEREAGSTVCAQIKGVGTGEVLLPCPACVRLGARLAAEVALGERCMG